MQMLQRPCGRRSIAQKVAAKPDGAHQRIICCGSVQASKTRSRGASITRSKRSRGGGMATWGQGSNDWKWSDINSLPSILINASLLKSPACLAKWLALAEAECF